MHIWITDNSTIKTNIKKKRKYEFEKRESKKFKNTWEMDITQMIIKKKLKDAVTKIKKVQEYWQDCHRNLPEGEKGAEKHIHLYHDHLPDHMSRQQTELEVYL